MAPIDRFRRPADLPRQIPVFPLRAVILLPRATLPLNLFEPRYLQMIEDVVSGNRIIGIAQPERAAGDPDDAITRDDVLDHLQITRLKQV